jgi:branched-chain amino acid transport system substrate-binding protein
MSRDNPAGFCHNTSIISKETGMKKGRLLCSLLAIAGLLLAACATVSSSGLIKVGAIGELTGSEAAQGASFKNAAQLAVEQINDTGGLEVGGKKYIIQLTIADNESRVDRSSALVYKLYEQNNVLAIIGPNADRFAIPASETAERIEVSLITPRSTDLKTTVDPLTGLPKKYVFRACLNDADQGRLLAKFALEKLGAKKAAALYDDQTDTNRTIAEAFKQTFETNGGQVVAFETYTSGEHYYGEQLTRIKESSPDIILLPNDYSDIPSQVQQARRLGISAPFLGSDAGGEAELVRRCGADCEGSYYSAHFSVEDPAPVTQEFVAAYTAEYDSPPDETAALTYDAFNLLWRALQSAGATDRQAVRDALAKISQFTGVTGTIQFQAGSGDPIKSAVILQIQHGKFEFFSTANP